MKAREVFDPKACATIEASIAKAELLTSGEVRFYVEDNLKGDVLDRAAQIFEHLNMHATEQRNGVLVYLAVGARQFAIIGDIGINNKVPVGFWDSVKETMQGHFKNGQLVEGVCAGILASGEKLAEHFPRLANDRNELSNQVVVE